MLKKRDKDYSFELSDDDSYYIIKQRITEEQIEIINSEKDIMPNITSYSTVFRFMARIQERLDHQDMETKILTSAFIKADEYWGHC